MKFENPLRRSGARGPVRYATGLVGRIRGLGTERAEHAGVPARRVPRIWIWTVICAEDEGTLVENGTRGRLYNEPVAHVPSAVREQSMFPTLGSLCDVLWAAGYTSIELVRREMTKNGNGPAILLWASRSAGAPSAPTP